MKPDTLIKQNNRICDTYALRNGGDMSFHIKNNSS